MKTRQALTACVLAFTLALNAGAADAAKAGRHGKKPTRAEVRKNSLGPREKPPAAEAQAVHVCVLDTDRVEPKVPCQSLDDPEFNKAVDKPIAPASLVKIMTAYEVYKEAERKCESLDAPFITITAADNAQGHMGERDGRLRNLGGHILWLPPDTILTYREAIHGLTAPSANNIAVAVARNLAPDGQEETFAAMMTASVRALGLTETEFRNASGMPATGQVSTAREMALLLDHIFTVMGPEQFENLYGQPEVEVGGRTARNTNPLIRSRKPLIDAAGNPVELLGSKTGTIGQTFNMINLFRTENGAYGISIVMGCASQGARVRASAQAIQKSAVHLPRTVAGTATP